MKGLRRWVSGLAVAALVLTSLPLLPRTAQAAVSCTPQYAPDGHPFINPTAQGPGSGKKVGFDSAHAETAGQADWVIDGGFSDMACALAGQGYFVEEMRTYPVTTAAMSAYDVVVFAESNMPLTNAEEQAIQDYVAGGKGVLFVGDHYQSDRNLNTWDSPEVFNGFRRGHYGQTYTTPAFNYNGFTTTTTYTFNNGSDWLAQAFGFRFRYNALDLSGANFHPGTTPDDPGILPPEQTYGVTSGVYSVATYAGDTISIVDPAKALGVIYPNKNSVKMWSSAQANDPVGVYTDNVGTPAGGSATFGGINEGAYVVIAKPSLGKVAAAGDSSLWEDATPKYKREDTGATKSTHDGWSDSDHDTLGINLVNWLATPDSATSINPSLRQQVTPEPYDPFTIAEPIVEPWSTPAAGFKWYDACTFKAGAYIGNTVCNNPPPVTTGWNVSYVPANVYPGNKPAAYLDATGLTAGATYTNNFYWYVNQGGTQIGHRYNRSTNTYDATAYNFIPLIADSQGKIQRWEFWNLDSGTATRNVNMRLRVGTSSSYTTPFTSSVIPQNVGGTYGYLKVEQALGLSDGTHAALFTKDGILDTTAQILPGTDTTITLPAGTYTLDVRNDTTTKVSGLSVKITAGQTVSLSNLEAPPAAWSFDNVPANIYPGNKLAATLTATGLTANTAYANQAYIYLTGGDQVSQRYDRTSGQFVDGLTAQTLTADATGAIQRLEFWQITPTANTTADYNLRVKVDGQTKDTKVIKQVATGSFGYLTIEQSLGYSDGLHAALFTANGVLDTAVGINSGADTTVTLPAGTYSLDIKNDAGAKKTAIPVTITAGQTVSLARLLAPQAWAFNYVPVNAYPGNTLALFSNITGLTPNTDYSYQAYVYLTGGVQVSKRYNRTTGTFADGLTAQTLTANADGAIQRWEFWQLTQTADKTSAYNARIKLGSSNKVTSQIKQVATGNFGSLKVEQSLGYSDGLHAALFTRDGALDTTAGISKNADTTVTLPEGTYSLEIRDDSGVSLTGVTFTVTAGKTTSLVAVLDKTPPTISGVAAPAPNADGWNNSDVTVTFTCDDKESGLATCTQPVTLATEGANQSVTGTAVDNAGNTATVTVNGINIDKTAPVIVAEVAAPNENGWYNAPVTVHFTCTDNLSGVAVCPGAVTLTEANGTATVIATDKAGNTATTTVTAKIDTTAPTIAGAADRPANAAGWYNADVIVTFTCSDALSGVATCTQPVALATEGANQSATGTAADQAGNTATVTVSGINIDKTAPVVTVTGNRTYTADEAVTVTCTATDGLSGLVDQPCAAPLFNAPAYTFTPGQHDVTVTATDKAGNTTTVTVSFTVAVTFESLTKLTDQFVTSAGAANSLDAKLKAAQAASEKGNLETRNNVLKAYQNEVKAQAGGKFLTAAGATVLDQLAGYLMN